MFRLIPSPEKMQRDSRKTTDRIGDWPTIYDKYEVVNRNNVNTSKDNSTDVCIKNWRSYLYRGANDAGRHSIWNYQASR